MSAISIPASSSPQKTASQAHREFADYLSETKNTVCGRHPIGVLLGTLAALQSEPPASPKATMAATAVASPGLPAVVAASAGPAVGQGQDWAKVEVRFVRYEQSSKCQRASDSSVSYASAYLRLL